MTELHREHPGYAKASPYCSEMARAEERASILFDLATAHGSGALSMKTALVSSVGNSRSSKLRFALRPHHVLTDAPEHAAKIVRELLSKRICKHRRSFLRDKYQTAGAHGDRQQ